MTPNERTLLLGVAAAVAELLRERCPDLPPYGWGGLGHSPEWAALYQFNDLIDAVQGERKAAPDGTEV